MFGVAIVVGGFRVDRAFIPYFLAPYFLIRIDRQVAHDAGREGLGFEAQLRIFHVADFRKRRQLVQ